MFSKAFKAGIVILAILLVAQFARPAVEKYVDDKVDGLIGSVFAIDG